MEFSDAAYQHVSDLPCLSAASQAHAMAARRLHPCDRFRLRTDLIRAPVRRVLRPVPRRRIADRSGPGSATGPV